VNIAMILEMAADALGDRLAYGTRADGHALHPVHPEKVGDASRREGAAAQLPAESVHAHELLGLVEDAPGVFVAGEAHVLRQRVHDAPVPRVLRQPRARGAHELDARKCRRVGMPGSGARATTSNRADNNNAVPGTSRAPRYARSTSMCAASIKTGYRSPVAHSSNTAASAM